MAKNGYIPKTQATNMCSVMLPSTEIGKATRASFQSLILQLEKHFNSKQIVRSLTLEQIAQMKKITLSIDDGDLDNQQNENKLSAGVSVNDFIQGLKHHERELSKRANELVHVELNNSLTLSIKYKPRIKMVPITKEVPELLILIDGSNVLTTAYHATKKNMLKNSKGTYTNAVYIMAQKVMDMISRSRPTHLAICWDEGREHTFRRKIYPAYKANRKESDPELKQQFATAKQLFSNIGIPQFSHEEIEADDAIGTINDIWRKEKGNAIVGIISNDKDLFQLLSEYTSQLISKSNKEYKITPIHLLQKWNVTPGQWVDCKALLGDKSDNIPGCAGVGEKAAYPLIENYGSLEVLYENLNELKDTDFKRYATKLEENKELAFLSKQLAQIRCDATDLLKLNSLDQLKINIKKRVVLHHFKALEFKSLINNIEKGMYRIG